MGILKRVGNAVRALLTESTVGGGPDFVDDFIDRDESEFRQIGKQTIRDLGDNKRRRQLEMSYFLYLSNPIAYRAMEITRDFVIGDGMTFKAVAPEVQKVLDNFWKDPVNRWDLKQFTRALELGLYGEQFYPVGVSSQNGRVRMAYLDPLDVVEVRTDPNNVEIPRTVVAGMPGSGAGSGTGQATNDAPPVTGGQGRTEDESRATRELRVINVDEDPESPTFGKLVGDVFFFAINKVSNAVRGNSDLLPVIDWLETHDQFLFGIHEAAILKTSVIWDVMVRGADKKALQDMEKKFARIKKGMTRFHNDKVEVKTVTADLQTADLGEHARIIKLHIASGLGLPEHWLAEGGNANRATAAEMGVPTTKRLRSRQIFFKNMLDVIFQFVIDQAIIHGRLPEDVNRSFTIFAPQIWAIDTSTIATSLMTLSQALVVAEDQAWVTADEAKELWTFIARQLGIELTNAGILDAPDEPLLASDDEEKDIDYHVTKLTAIGAKYREHLEKHGGNGSTTPGTVRAQSQ